MIVSGFTYFAEATKWFRQAAGKIEAEFKQKRQAPIIQVPAAFASN
jgi:hypothetical protein